MSVVEQWAIAKVRAGTGVDLIRCPVPMPAPAPGEVFVRPLVVGICGSDIKTYRWREDRQQVLNAAMPVILGHEVVGEVIAVGGPDDAAGSALTPGDIVVTDPIVSCGACRLCVSGRHHICQFRRQIGHQLDGGLCETAQLPTVTLRRLPEGVPIPDAPLLEVLATAAHAIERVGTVAGVACAVIGLGPLGLMLIRALRAAGAASVLAVGTTTSPQRLVAATASGANEVITNVEDVRDLIDSYEAVFEVAGSPAALELAARLTRRGGKLVYASGFDVPIDLPSNTLLKTREIDLLTSTGHPESAWERATAWASTRQVDLGGVIDYRTQLVDGLTAFEKLANREVVKAVIHVGAPL